jgi:DNA-binding CsgD family transcriptional regulator
MVLFAQGYTRQQIADELGIGIETVKTYLEQVRHKLDARNGTHAVTLCIILGLLEGDDLTES